MRIAHLTATFPPYYGGTGSVCFYNTIGLARLGHQVTVFTAERPLQGWQDPPDITVRRLPTMVRVGNATVLHGLEALKNYDIVHIHYPFFFGADMVFLRSLLQPTAYVITYHQDVLFAGVLGVAEWLHHRVFGRRILAGARRVFATSMDYARSSRLSTLLANRPGLIAELPNGVDTERFHPGNAARALRERYGFRPSDRIVGFVGALDRAHYFKGIHLLLQAAQSNTHCKLLIIGDGALRSSYQQLAEELGIRDRAIFAGRVPDEALADHYAAIDILVLPSTTMGEAFGLVLLEAMASGKPVIASDLPGVRSVVEHNTDGVLTPPGDLNALRSNLTALINDPDRCREMGARGRDKVAARYDWRLIVPCLAEAYAEALVPSQGRAP